MKKIIKVLMSCALVVSFNSCSDSNNVIDEVLQYETGAILRTIEITSNTLNSGDASTNFSVTIEEQDEADGGLLKAVHLYGTLKDLTPDNGSTVAADILIKTYDASEFTTGPVGLPRATLSATWGETSAAMGLNLDNSTGGDIIVYVLKLELTDGRIYDDATQGGSVTGGFFNAPHRYNALLLCAPEPGTYRVEMHDSYGDGWQTTTGSGGAGIAVTIDGAVTEIGLCSPYGGSNVGTFLDESLGNCTPNNGYDGTAFVTIPVGALEATWDFPGDRYGEIFFEVYGPNDEELFLSGGPGDTAGGLLPVALCASN